MYVSILYTVSPEGSVTVLPKITNSFQGDIVTLTCSAMGGPRNLFLWTRLYNSFVVGNMSSLTVSVSSATDGGQYRCDVTNLAGNDSETTTLNGELFIVCLQS